MNLTLTITEQQHKQLVKVLDVVLRSTGLTNLSEVVDLYNVLQNVKVEEPTNAEAPIAPTDTDMYTGNVDPYERG